MSGTRVTRGAVRALLVEDNPGDVELVRERLETDEHRPIVIEVVRALAEVRPALRSRAFDVILLDLGMPDSRGIATLERVRGLAPATPVIVVTGHDDPELAARCFEEGAYGFLVKGRTEAALVQVIHSTVAAVRAQTDLGQAHEDWRRMADDSRDGIVVVDDRDAVRFANRAAAAILGRVPREGEPLSFGLEGDEQEPVEVSRPDGTKARVELRLGRTQWRGTPARLLTLRDVTERERAAAREHRLLGLIAAIRSVNQLIAHEKDPRSLVEQACELLVEARGYEGAWIALESDQGAVGTVVGAGLGDPFPRFAQHLQTSGWPRCRDAARAARSGVATLDPSWQCEGCELRTLHVQGAAVVAALRHGTTDYGLLGIAIPAVFDMGAEELALLAEVATDLAFALFVIEADLLRRASEERIRVSFERSAVPQALTSLDGRFIRVNAALCELLDYPPAELVGKHFADVTHPDDLAASRGAVRTLLSSRDNYRFEKRYLRRDGTAVWADVSASVFRGATGEAEHFITTLVDISQRKAAEEALVKERDFATQLVETAQAVVLLLDPAGKIVSFNPYTEALTGYPLDEVRGRDWFELFVPESNREATRALFAQATANCPTRGNVDSLRTRDGQQRLVEWFDKTLTDSAGNVVGLLCLGQDVTKRERAAAETRALLDATRALVEEVEPAGALRRIFDACRALLGAPAGYVALRTADGRNEVLFLEAEGLPCSVDPALPMPIRGLRAEAYESGRAVYHNDFRASEHWQFMPAGHAVLANVLFVPLTVAGAHRGLLGLANKPHGFDERDARLAEAFGELGGMALHRTESARSLAASEARYRLLAENVRDVIWTADLAMRLTYASASQYDITGYTAAETLGRPVADLLTAESARRVRELLQPALEAAARGGGEPAPLRPIELEHVRKDGSRGWVEVHASLLRGADGQPTGIVGVTRDVTEKRALQAAAAQSDRLTSMGVLAAGVAHEINNPLSYVLSNLESAAEELPAVGVAMQRCHAELAQRLGPDALAALLGDSAPLFAPAALDDLQDRLREAFTGTQRIRVISRALGAFSRVERTAEAKIDLHRTIEHAVTMAHNEIKYRARLVKEFGVISPVVASEGKVAQVFLNLLVNAAHAIDEGAVERHEIRIRTWADSEHVFAEVHDTGRGIPPELQSRVFEPFFTTKDVGVGSGLGLAICRNIVESFGGTIELRSELGRGTAVRVAFPVGRPVSVESAVELPRAEQPAARGRILVVDDEPGIRKSFARMLGREHDVVEAESGRAAQAILEADAAFDVIFCDMMMPEVSGMDLHEWLAARNPTLGRRVVFVTGGAFTPRARDYLACVDNLRLEKPFELASVKKLTRELVRAVRERLAAG